MQEPFSPSFYRRLQQLKIRTRRSFLGTRQGTHRSLRKGHGLEFSDYRPYAPGDDFRHIDWGVYGRSDRLYVRQFREEQDLNVVFLLDCSHSMAYPRGEGKFELAKQLSMALGYVALTDGDTVSYALLGQGSTPKYSGPRAVNRVARALHDVEARGTIDMLTEVRAALAKHRIPGKCFLVSDFMFEHEEQFATLDYLRSRNFEICCIHVLSPSELSLKILENDTLVDAESGERLEVAFDASAKREYAVMLAKHIEALESYCQRNGIVHALVSSDENVADIVLTRFPELGVLK